MSEQEIPPAEQGQFLAWFSKLHQGALITVRVGKREEVVNQAFRGLSADGAEIIINTGDGSGRTHHGHRVAHVAAVRLEQTDEGADAAVAVISEDGKRTEVRFQSPMRADLLDPAVE